MRRGRPFRRGFPVMAAGGSDLRTADVEEDASQLVFPKGESGGGEGSGIGWWLGAGSGRL